MNIQIIRREFTSHATIGDLFIDGVWVCFTLEDTVREREGQPVSEWKLPGRTAIPKGLYRVAVTWSNRFQRETPQILDVPGFLGIRIHPGNSPADTEGCILPGFTKSPEWVGKSRQAFTVLEARIREALSRNEDVFISIT